MKSDSLCFIATSHVPNNCKFMSYNQDYCVLDYTFTVKISMTIVGGGGLQLGFCTYITSRHYIKSFPPLSKRRFVTSHCFFKTFRQLTFLNVCPLALFHFLCLATHRLSLLPICLIEAGVQ